MNFSELVKDVRQNLNISQEQLARGLDMSFSTINRWENGRTTPSKLARARFIEYCRESGISRETIGRLSQLKTNESVNHARGK